MAGTYNNWVPPAGSFSGFSTAQGTGALQNWQGSSFNGLNPVTTAPDAPTSVVAVAGDSQATITWTDGSDGGSPVTSYNIVSSPATTTQHFSSGGVFTGLTNGVAYTFTVSATNAIGTGPASSASNSVTPAYASPYLLEILSTRTGAPSWVSPPVASTITANTGQTVSCSRAASAYCLGDDGLLHLLGANTVRVEPLGLLVEGAGVNLLLSSNAVGDSNWSVVIGTPTVTLNSTDVLDPAGGNQASKIVLSAGSGQAVFQNCGQNNKRFSMYLRAPTGQTYTVDLDDANGTRTHCSLTDQWQRFDINETIGFCGVGNYATSGAAGTFYAWGGQAENTPFVTSLIPTTGSTGSRGADAISCTNPLGGTSPAVWSMGAHFKLLPAATWANMETAGGVGRTTPLNIGNATAADSFLFSFVGSGTAGQLFLGGSLDYSGGTLAPGTDLTVGFSVTAASPASTDPTPGPITYVGSGVGFTQSATANWTHWVAHPNDTVWAHMRDMVIDNTRVYT